MIVQVSVELQSARRGCAQSQALGLVVQTEPVLCGSFALLCHVLRLCHFLLPPSMLVKYSMPVRTLALRRVSVQFGVVKKGPCSRFIAAVHNTHHTLLLCLLFLEMNRVIPYTIPLFYEPSPGSRLLYRNSYVVTACS